MSTSSYPNGLTYQQKVNVNETQATDLEDKVIGQSYASKNLVYWGQYSTHTFKQKPSTYKHTHTYYDKWSYLYNQICRAMWDNVPA